jgi:hypothetical protein
VSGVVIIALIIPGVAEIGNANGCYIEELTINITHILIGISIYDWEFNFIQ